MTTDALPDAGSKPSTRLLNREIGILAFNERVLAQAEDPAIPLLERLRYLTIVSNNLDELFEVRVAELKELMRADPETQLDSGPVADALRLVSQRAGRLVSKDQLVERLCEWGEEVSNNAIEVYIHRLRKKIEQGPIRIATVRGLGYCLEKIQN
jgi:polyphosphate kinase